MRWVIGLKKIRLGFESCKVQYIKKLVEDTWHCVCFWVAMANPVVRMCYGGSSGLSGATDQFSVLPCRCCKELLTLGCLGQVALRREASAASELLYEAPPMAPPLTPGFLAPRPCSAARTAAASAVPPPKLIMSATTNTLIRSWLNSLHQRTGTLTSEVVFTTQHLDLIRNGLQYLFSVLLLLKGEIVNLFWFILSFLNAVIYVFNWNTWAIRWQQWSIGFWMGWLKSAICYFIFFIFFAMLMKENFVIKIYQANLFFTKNDTPSYLLLL